MNVLNNDIALYAISPRNCEQGMQVSPAATNQCTVVSVLAARRYRTLDPVRESVQSQEHDVVQEKGECISAVVFVFMLHKIQVYKNRDQVKRTPRAAVLCRSATF